MAETTHMGQRWDKLSWTAEFFTVFRSIHRPYITFKLPRGDMDTPPRPCNFFLYLAIRMCHFRHLWNGMCDRHWVEITDMQFTGHSLPVHHFVMAQRDFLPCLILSAKLYFTLLAILFFKMFTREHFKWISLFSPHSTQQSNCTTWVCKSRENNKSI